MRQKVIWHILILAVLIGAAHLAAIRFYLYFWVRGYDIPMHIVGGALIAMCALWFWFLSGWVKIPLEKKWIYSLTMISVLVVAIVWEIWEEVFGLTGNSTNFQKRLDLSKDLIDDVLGAVLVLYFYTSKILAEKNKGGDETQIISTLSTKR